jgi:hypothetical protein
MSVSTTVSSSILLIVSTVFRDAGSRQHDVDKIPTCRAPIHSIPRCFNEPGRNTHIQIYTQGFWAAGSPYVSSSVLLIYGDWEKLSDAQMAARAIYAIPLRSIHFGHRRHSAQEQTLCAVSVHCKSLFWSYLKAALTLSDDQCSSLSWTLHVLYLDEKIHSWQCHGPCY